MGSWYVTIQPGIGLEVPSDYYPFYRGVNTGTMFMRTRLDWDLDRRIKLWTIFHKDLPQCTFLIF
jgi:hypothetical protein